MDDIVDVLFHTLFSTAMPLPTTKAVWLVAVFASTVIASLLGDSRGSGTIGITRRGTRLDLVAFGSIGDGFLPTCFRISVGLGKFLTFSWHRQI
jgi:hypothetical protein